MSTTIEPVVLVEYFNEHWYKIIEGDTAYYIPSVTTKLAVKDKPWLARWRGDVGNREADLRVYDSQQKGKRIHWAWEIALKGGVVVYDPWQNPVYTQDQIKELEKKHGAVAVLRTQDEMIHIHRLQKQFAILRPRIIDVEKTVYDLETMDAGTIDHVYEIQTGDYEINGAKPLHLEGGIYIGDLKTGAVVTDDVWMQLAPYKKMYEKMTNQTVVGAIVSHTQGNTKRGIPGLSTMVRTARELDTQDYPDYRHASELWMREHKDDQPQTYQIPSLIQLERKILNVI